MKGKPYLKKICQFKDWKEPHPNTYLGQDLRELRKFGIYSILQPAYIILLILSGLIEFDDINYLDDASQLIINEDETAAKFFTACGVKAKRVVFLIKDSGFIRLILAFTREVKPALGFEITLRNGKGKISYAKLILFQPNNNGKRGNSYTWKL